MEKTIKDEYIVKFEKYTRYDGTTTKTRKFKASSEYEALANVYIKNNYGSDLEDCKEDCPTCEELLEAIEMSNGDGCDFVFYFANVTTGKVYINVIYTEDVE